VEGKPCRRHAPLRICGSLPNRSHDFVNERKGAEDFKDLDSKYLVNSL
jgi:hypothetical protein